MIAGLDADVIADITHETRGCAGTIRLAVTTLLQNDDDPVLRAQLLGAIEVEVRRLTADLAVLPALAAVAADTSPTQPVELGRLVANLAQAEGLVFDEVPVMSTIVAAPPAAVATLLGALLRVAAARGATSVALAPSESGVCVRLHGADLHGRVATAVAAAARTLGIEVTS